jgi:hypothetical protein
MDGGADLAWCSPFWLAADGQERIGSVGMGMVEFSVIEITPKFAS